MNRYIYLRLDSLIYTSINYPLLQKVCIPDYTNDYKLAYNEHFSLFPLSHDFLDEIHHYVFCYNAYTKVNDIISELEKYIIKQ